MGTNHEDTHINESILSEAILEDQKKNRIDHMTYLPGMEDIGSEILDQVVANGLLRFAQQRGRNACRQG